MKRRAVYGGVCGLAVVALALTACSPNSSTGSGSLATSGSAAHGKPINLAFPTEFTGAGTGGDGFAGAEAALRYVNAHGGIHGRPLAAQECVDNDAPNQAAACAAKAANNPSIVASVISAGTESASAVQQQMGGGQNLYFDTFFNHSGRFYDAFLSQWQAAGNSPSLADDFAINGWLAVTMFADIARTLPTITRASSTRRSDWSSTRTGRSSPQPGASSRTRSSFHKALECRRVPGRG
jgi:Periplasmic binding protein